MKPTLKIVFDRKKQATKTTPALVQIEVYYKGTRKYFSTGIKVISTEWDNSNKRVKGTPNDFNYNYHISNLCKKIEDFIIDLERKDEQFSFAKLGSLVSGNGNSDLSFEKYFLEVLNRKNISEGTRKKLMTLYNHIERFGKLRTFADLTQSNIKKFYAYLSDIGLAKSSVHGRHKQLQYFVNEAVSDGYLSQTPYVGIKIQKGRDKDPTFLLESELNQILEYHPNNDKLERVQDVFVFQCFTGLSYSDLALFSKTDIQQLDGKKIIRSNRRKTDESFVSLLLPQAQKVLEKYDYELPVISNAKYNDYLKLLGIGAGINKKLTSHVARHTYATYLLNKGISISTVSRAIGHANVKMTQHYAKLLGKTVIDEMSVLLE